MTCICNLSNLTLKNFIYFHMIYVTLDLVLVGLEFNEFSGARIILISEMYLWRHFNPFATGSTLVCD